MQRNISGLERVLRLCLGLGICTAVLVLGHTNVADGALLLVGFFLVLNGHTARCYLWRWLGINSFRRAGGCPIGSDERSEA
jgi:hypothetical protein